MRKITAKKATFFVVAIAFLIVWNIGSYHVVAHKGIDFFSAGDDSNLGINVIGVIDPPLGNATRPGIGAMFSMMVLVLPTEITIVCLAEIVISSATGLDPKKKSLTRLGIMLGSASAISVFTGIVNYLLIYPAIHDIPIHTKTYLEPGTGEDGIPAVYIPQYGDAETFYSLGLNVFFLILAIIIIIGLHFVAFRFIQGLKYSATGISCALPVILYPILWSTLINQETVRAFDEMTGSIWTLTLIIGLGFILIILLLLLWKLTLLGTAPKEDKDPTAPQIDKMP